MDHGERANLTHEVRDGILKHTESMPFTLEGSWSESVIVSPILTDIDDAGRDY